jgi:hypothetical protein
LDRWVDAVTTGWETPAPRAFPLGVHHRRRALAQMWRERPSSPFLSCGSVARRPRGWDRRACPLRRRGPCSVARRRVLRANPARVERAQPVPNHRPVPREPPACVERPASPCRFRIPSPVPGRR